MTFTIQDTHWVSLEVVGSAIFEIRNASSSIIQIAHPKPVSWRYLIGRVARTLDVPVVPFHEWLTQLEALVTTSKAKEVMAIALLETYRAADNSAARIAPRVSHENALREAPSLATAQPLTETDVDSWLYYWKSVSLISF